MRLEYIGSVYGEKNFMLCCEDVEDSMIDWYLSVNIGSVVYGEVLCSKVYGVLVDIKKKRWFSVSHLSK